VFYLSKLLGSPVKDVENKPAGTLHDLVVNTTQAYPRVTAVGVRRRGRTLYTTWDAVSSFEESGLLLRIPAAELVERPLEPDELPLSATFLDKQLVDTEGRKVIRVNDIQLLRNGPFVHVAAVDVSSNAILRRVGLAKVGDRISKTRQKPRPHLIDWKDVDIEQTDEAAVRLAVPQTKLELLHPADIAELVHELSPEERAAVFDALEDDLAADTFEELHPSYQASLLLDLPDEKASEILNEMSPDDAASTSSR
jgi:sporulation protein YlmC with PRC-barrel domain